MNGATFKSVETYEPSKRAEVEALIAEALAALDKKEAR